MKEKFSTELSSGSDVLVKMVETLASNVDHYITTLNNPSEISAVSSYSNPSSYQHHPEAAAYDPAMVGFQFARGGGYQGNQRGFFPHRGAGSRGSYSGRGGPPLGRGGFAPGQGRRVAGLGSQRGRGERDCVYCYMESRNGNNVDYRHPITNCPKLSNMYGRINYVDTVLEEEIHPFEDTVQDYYYEDENVDDVQQ